MSENAGNVAIVIVSHSAKVAEGAADMARQMVGENLAIAWCGGDPDGGLGTDMEAIKACIEDVYSPAGVLITVDLGGADMNAEMAIEFLKEHGKDRIRIADAPIVEGTVLAAIEASSGGDLDEVKAAAEERETA